MEADEVIEQEDNDEDASQASAIQTISSVQPTESPPNPLAYDPAFEEKPLEERLIDEGVGKLYELILRQRALQNELAVKSGNSDFQGRPLYPEVRVGSISSQGNVGLDFTRQMMFPENFASMIN